MAVAALPRGLLVRQHHRADLQARGGPHGGVELRVVDNGAAGKLAAEAVEVDHGRGILQLQAEADVHGARRMRDGARRHEIRAGFRVGPHV